ncbi:MAG TPA: HAD family hydrolase [Candidatus Binatia bacterium]|jgi:putative hydrolase of the HAD superfamily|nr:HAD family hydrolase [Candidatus Binatia bacterium]
MFELIALDADDTLWHNEDAYHLARARFRELMAKYDVDGAVDECADHLEVANIDFYGYGVMSFVLSLIEAGLDLTGDRFRGEDVRALVDLAKTMLTAEVSLYQTTEEVVSRLSEAYELMVITKGDLLHQRNKVLRSGLGDYFGYVEVLSHKRPQDYAEILARYDVAPERFLMVGNSMRSDVLPVVEIGGWAIHVPSENTWAHEVAELPDHLQERVFEAQNLSEVPALIKKLEDSLES